MIPNNLRIALLIDGDNAQPSLIQPVLKAVSAYGHCVIQRVYGDWMAANMTSWRNVEQTHAVQLVQQSRYVAGKNATDIAITIAAMDILHSDKVKVNAFCIVSSDSDFTPLVVRLRNEGVTVIAIGREDTSESLRNACTKFISIAELVPPPKPSKTPAPKALETPAPKPLEAPPPKPSKPILWHFGFRPAPEPLEAPASKPLETPPPKPLPTPSPAPKNDAAPPTQYPNPRPLLKQAYKMSAPQGEEWVFLGQLGQNLRQIDANFATKTYGQSSLTNLVSQCADIFEYRQKKGAGNTTNMYVRLKK